ncbi:doxx family protein [Flavobacterium flavipallidum]|uniref:Doxx family protein n=1 Tax=Flavobacterium flavipallidum TaxID=3139140 RepID=A0ABU9HRC1_9FLAO
MKKTQVVLSEGFTSNRLIIFSIGIVYFVFGLLKFFPNFSPAEDIAKKTIDVLINNSVHSDISYLVLAMWETLIGLFFIINYKLRTVTILAIIHLSLTFSVFFIFPELSFNQSPFSFTLLGQYIVKNIVILSVLVSLLINNRTVDN